MRLFATRYLLLIILIINAGCTDLLDDDQTKIYKCEKSAMYLEKNEALMRKAVSWKREQLLLKTESREDIFENTQKLNKIMMEVMNGEGQLDRDILLDWYESDYCVTLLKDYQDYEYGNGNENKREQEIISDNKSIEEALMRQVAHYSTSLVDKNTREVSCDKFKEQVDMTYNNPSSIQFRKELESGLILTIKDSLHNFKKFQSSCVDEQLKSENIETFSKEIKQNCPDGHLLSNEIIYTDKIKYCQSKRSSEISELLNKIEKTHECGDIPEIFCLSEIQQLAAKNAYSMSEKCDKEDNINNKSCLLDSKQMYSEELSNIEVSKLEEARKIYEDHINDPIHNNILDQDNSVLSSGGYAKQNLSDLIDKCMTEAKKTNTELNSMSGGMSYDPPEIKKEKLAKYEQYKKETCEPYARNELTKPAREILDKILKRLKEINNGSTHIESKSLNISSGKIASNNQIFKEAEEETTLKYNKKWEEIRNNPATFLRSCVKQEERFIVEVENIPSSEAETKARENCNAQLTNLKNCMSKPDAKAYECYVEIFETGD